jgi:iron complex outermembrane receptor protein
MRLDITDAINVTAGLRHTVTTISANNNWPTATSTSPLFNDSKSYERALPVASVSYFFNPLNHLYVSVGQGYDTPTLNQIKYSCNTGCTIANTSPNFLNAATTSQVELGYKTVIPEIGSINVALFDAVSNNEIVALANISGKTVYQNANGTARKGFEISGHFDLNERFYSNLSYSYTNAQVTDTYKAGASTITAGNAIPGVPQNKLFGELAFHLPQDAINVGLEVLGLSQMYAADTNNATSNAAGYVIANVRAFAKQHVDHWAFTEFARLNNVSDVQYVGSVIINQSSNQYFEPAVGRNWVLGASASYLF